MERPRPRPSAGADVSGKGWGNIIVLQYTHNVSNSFDSYPYWIHCTVK